MEKSKNSERTSSSNGEILERGATKNEKTHHKITLPTFEKRGIQEAKLRWRRFTQYIKMTQNVDLNIMTTDRKILEQYRAELEKRIKDLFICALGESAITEITRTVRDNDPNKMDIKKLYSDYILFQNVTSFTVEQISSESQERKLKQPKTSGREFYK